MKTFLLSLLSFTFLALPLHARWGGINLEKKPYKKIKLKTKIEKRYDLDKDGWLNQRERWILEHSHADTAREIYCDANYNGVIDVKEIECAYKDLP